MCVCERESYDKGRDSNAGKYEGEKMNEKEKGCNKVLGQ